MLCNFMEHMMPLEQMGPRLLKEDPETEEDCYTHTCRHCDALLRTPWKVISSKKSEIGGSYYATCNQCHLDNIHADAFLASVLPSL